MARHRLLTASGAVASFDPPSKKPHFIADFDSFVVSPNGRWLAGEFFGSGVNDITVAVVSLETGKCVVVPRERGKADFISEGLRRSGFTRSDEVAVIVGVIDESRSGPPTPLGRGTQRVYRIADLRDACPRRVTKGP